MHEPRAVHDLDQRVELEVAFGRHLRRVRLVGFPGLVVVDGGFEPLADRTLDAGAGRRVARVFVVEEVGLLGVLAEGEFDAFGCARDLQLFGQRAPTQFDHRVLSADRVRRSVQQVGRREAAGQLAVDLDRLGVDHVADANLGGGDVRTFVDPADDRGVAVRVDQARRHVFAGTVDHDRISRRAETLADLGDFALFYQEVRVFQHALRSAGPDRRALHQDGGRLFGRGILPRRDVARGLGCRDGRERGQQDRGEG